MWLMYHERGSACKRERGCRSHYRSCCRCCWRLCPVSGGGAVVGGVLRVRRYTPCIRPTYLPTYVHICITYVTYFLPSPPKIRVANQVALCRHLRDACWYVSMHACVYIHAPIHTYIHASIHPYIHACMHAYMHAYMHTCIHAYVHTCIRAYVHTYYVEDLKLQPDQHHPTSSPPVGMDCQTPCLHA